MTDENTDRANCDSGITALARLLLEGGVTPGLLIDRLLTFSAAHAVAWTGPDETARAFRAMADKIEGGIFAEIESRKSGAKH